MQNNINYRLTKKNKKNTIQSETHIFEKFLRINSKVEASKNKLYLMFIGGLEV